MSENLALFNIGGFYETRREITPELLTAFCEISGDDNPVHLDDDFARAHGFQSRIAFGNIMGLMISRLIGAELPTREVLILTQSLEFRQPAYVGDNIHLIAEVISIHKAVSSVQLKLQFYSVDLEPICTGRCLFKCL
jgi:acyl dehydratase